MLNNTVNLSPFEISEALINTRLMSNDEIIKFQDRYLRSGRLYKKDQQQTNSI